MGFIRFKLEDGRFLEGNFSEDSKYLEFSFEQAPGDVQQFKLHRMQVQALIKAINEPMVLNLEFKK